MCACVYVGFSYPSKFWVQSSDHSIQSTTQKLNTVTSGLCNCPTQTGLHNSDFTEVQTTAKRASWMLKAQEPCTTKMYGNNRLPNSFYCGSHQNGSTWDGRRTKPFPQALVLFFSSDQWSTWACNPPLSFSPGGFGAELEGEESKDTDNPGNKPTGAP